MNDNMILLKNCRLYNQEIKDILIAGKFIEKIGKNLSARCKTLDVKNFLVIPALIDPHVHVRDLEQSYKEDWISATNAALAGGHSFIFDMPNTKPPTINLNNFKEKLKRAKLSKINYKLIIQATNNNIRDLKNIIRKYNETVGAIKLYLSSSSYNEVIKKENLKEVFKLAKDFNKIIMIHTELLDCIKKWEKKISEKTIAKHHIIRNRECVIEGASYVVKLAKEVGNKIYLAHISTKEEIEILRNNPFVYSEVTPHHLFLDLDEIKKIGIIAKVNPPIRKREDRQALLEGVKDKIIDVIATDHAPHSKEEKLKDYSNSPSGIGGLETKIPLLITAVKKGILEYEDIIRTTALNPARIFGLNKHGAIKEGFYADICIIDDKEKFKIKSDNFFSKSNYSPFENMDVYGKVKYTIVSGKILFGG